MFDHKAYNKQYYLKHKAAIRAKNTAYRQGIVDWMTEYKSTLKCVECGFDNPVALQFHHRDPSQKVIEIGEARNQGWSIKRILEEIEKCDVLCANCHWIKHS